MNRDYKFNFVVVRYVPDPLREEFVNIAVALVASPPEKFGGLRRTASWDTLLKLDRKADLNVLSSILDEMHRALRSRGYPALHEYLSLDSSNVIQFSELRSTIASDGQAELDRLAAQYL